MTKSGVDNRVAAAGGKKTWIRPTAESIPASSAQISGGGSGDGNSCHS